MSCGWHYPLGIGSHLIPCASPPRAEPSVLPGCCLPTPRFVVRIGTTRPSGATASYTGRDMGAVCAALIGHICRPTPWHPPSTLCTTPLFVLVKAGVPVVLGLRVDQDQDHAQLVVLCRTTLAPPSPTQ